MFNVDPMNNTNKKKNINKCLKKSLRPDEPIRAKYIIFVTYRAAVKLVL